MMDNNSYDYIIVGSGPAGSVLAKALSDGGGASVLLLEAGPYRDGDGLIKSPHSNLYDHFPEYFWPGQSVPQKYAKNRSFNLTGGRVSGGGSSINGEMYVRPTPYVLGQWEKIGGAQWSPENATQRFLELEKYDGEENPLVHGTGGRLQIRQVYRQPPILAEKLVSAMEEASGLPAVNDFNDPKTPLGPFHNWQLYQKPDGDRASASACFLAPDIVSPEGEGADGRRLTVRYQATALRILFDESLTATGVTYLANGREETAYAGERVILSAGINSVKLLMLSGIGPEDVLKQAGVTPLHVNQNVGKGLAGDAYMSAVFTVNPDDVAVLAEADPHGKYPGGAFLPGSAAGAAQGERSIQMMPTQIFGQTLYMSVLCINPKSRGSLRIQSSDPLQIMLGDFGFLNDPQDVDTLKRTARDYVGKMGEALARIDPAYRLVAPGPDVLNEEDKLEEYIRASFIHTYHDQCELRMGSEQDGVVDGWGAVHGVRKLTVADASIIPYHMDGNTSACAYLIGSTIARHLLGQD